LEAIVIADLDTLLTALYVELTDRIIPSRGLARRGPGRPPEVTDAELACIAVAQVLLRFDDERHWLRAAPRLVGHLFPRSRHLDLKHQLGLERHGGRIPQACGPASPRDCSPSTPSSGSTGSSKPPSNAP
jgi:hypothetical protein